MTFRKIVLSVAFLATIFTLISKPAAAELSDQEKLERCHRNIVRIAALQKRRAELKKLLEYKYQDEKDARSLLFHLHNVVLKDDKGLQAFSMFFFEFDQFHQRDFGTEAKSWAEKYGLDWKKEYDDWAKFLKQSDESKNPAILTDAYLKSFRMFAQDFEAAVGKRVDQITEVIANHDNYSRELADVYEEIGQAEKTMEGYGCRDLLKVDRPGASFGQLIEDGRVAPPIADPDVWALVEVISDPGKITESAKYKETVWLPTATETETMQTNSYELKHQAWTDASQSKLTEDYHIQVKWEQPPATITPGKNFSLLVTASCTKSTKDMGGWVARFGGYEAGGGIAVTMTESSMAKPYVGLGDAGFVGNANATYTFTVPEAEQLSSEFVIEQKGAAIFKYKKGAQPIKAP